MTQITITTQEDEELTLEDSAHANLKRDELYCHETESAMSAQEIAKLLDQDSSWKRLAKARPALERLTYRGERYAFSDPSTTGLEHSEWSGAIVILADECAAYAIAAPGACQAIVDEDGEPDEADTEELKGVHLDADGACYVIALQLADGWSVWVQS